MKSNLSAIILGAAIIVAAIIYGCSTRYEIVTERDDRGFSQEYAFDRWTGELRQIHAH
jgi:hypothetical protein